MSFICKPRLELIDICKKNNIKGYSNKTKKELLNLLNMSNIKINTEPLDECQPANAVAKDKDDEHIKITNIDNNNDNNVKEIEIANTDYVFQPMLTCIGNKRKLVPHIKDIIQKHVMQPLEKEKINIVDGFAGSSVVSRALTYCANNLYSNDMELYSYLMSICHLQTPTEEQKSTIIQHIHYMNQLAETGPYIEGIVCKLYSPKVTDDIQKGERCFYTRENALIIDTLRKYIEDNVESDVFAYCISPLLIKASIHVNTAGVFKGFYKKGELGCFGGAAENALSRIMKPIRLDVPVWNESSSFVSRCFNLDINALVDDLPNDIDVIYLDPPYNQHPYGSNYFMLNIIAKNEEPLEISKVSGIPTDWNKSNYNKHDLAVKSMEQLLKKGLLKSKYLLISYNNEGIITTADWQVLFEAYNVQKHEIKYDTYKGCRNLKDRNNKVVEIMYIISLK